MLAQVRLEGVVKKYGGKVALRGIDLTCHEGEFLSIVGPTGAGKTTILKIVAGIESITSGSLYFNDRLMNNVPPQERNVSMAFETYNLYPHFTVYENIAFPLRAPRWGYKLSREEERARVHEIAEFLGIEEYLNRLPQQLSGGQKQRVSLARALVRQPEVYLLDEPIAHLDARLKFSTQTLLKKFAAEYGSTIIYVTHDYREALALSDRVVVLNRGRIEQVGTPQEVYDNPATPYVGTIIGEPPINLVEGELVSQDSGAVFRSDTGVAVRMDSAIAERAFQAAATHNGSARVCLGIRSEFVKVYSSREKDDTFPLNVFAVTMDSDEAIVTFQLNDGRLLYARLPERPRSLKVGDQVWVGLDGARAVFFPPHASRDEGVRR